MVPLTVEGSTLGRKHENFNKLVKEAIVNNDSFKLSAINLNEPDLNNLFKIDIASYNRDVKYILEVFKCEDELYVSRAIKQATWIITDERYAYIINPQYLHSHLLPEMIVKGSNKLLLHIRLNLKDERRAEEFFRYYEEKQQINLAMKWLPNCSLICIENAVNKYTDYITCGLFKKLCEKSITVFDIFFKKTDVYVYYKFYGWIKFLLKTHTEKYINFVESDPFDLKQSFNSKQTKIIMKKCPQKIIDNFDKYYKVIDIETFAKYVPKLEITNFLIKYTNMDDPRPLNWLSKPNHLSSFFKYLPECDRFVFLKKVFIDKIHEQHNDSKAHKSKEISCMKRLHCFIENRSYENNFSNIYRLVYQFAPYDIAFTDIKKRIQHESCPKQRIGLLLIILTSAHNNLEQLQTLIQYFHDKHMNETFNFKHQFINNTLKVSNVHKLDITAWRKLNEIFYSMEVYTKSEKNVQACIKYIILYKVLNNDDIPEIIENKFEFDSLKNYHHKLTQNEKERIFYYLYTLIEKKIENEIIVNHEEFQKVITLLMKLINLLLDYKKTPTDCPFLIFKINQLIKIKENNSWDTDLSLLYNAVKTWKKYMFENSLILCAREEVFLNVLKHNPLLLDSYKKVIDHEKIVGGISMKRFLKKLSIYWSESLAKVWAEAYRTQLSQPNVLKPAIESLCIMLPRYQLIDIIKKYVPNETIIEWGISDEYTSSLRKHITKSMHLARPQPLPEEILLYTKGDYLQYALPSLHAILYNLRPICSNKYVDILLQSQSVFLKTYGIRFAYIKLKSNNLIKIYSNIWKTTHHSIIRSKIFIYTHSLLCRETEPANIDAIWNLLEEFIDDLTQYKNTKIYNILGEVEKVPTRVKAKFLVKSYTCLNALPIKADFTIITSALLNHTVTIMDEIDPHFISDVLEDYIINKYSKMNGVRDFNDISIISSYLLCAENDEAQSERYRKIFIPLWEISLASWSVKRKNKFYYRNRIQNLLQSLARCFTQYIVTKKHVIIPVKLFTKIQVALESSLPILQNYLLLRSWKLLTGFVKSFEESITVTDIDNNAAWDELCLKCVDKFGETCLQYFKDDVTLYDSSICDLFSRAMNALRYLSITSLFKWKIFNVMLAKTNSEAAYLLVLDVIPVNDTNDEDENKILTELRKRVLTHPSKIVKTSYYQTYNYFMYENPAEGLVDSFID